MGQFNLRTFAADVTPPVGDYLCGGLHSQSVGIETPLYLQGVILSTAQTRHLVAVMDCVYLVGRSHQRLREALAQAAGIPAELVTLHANHVHDAPLIDEEVQCLIKEQVPGVHNEKYFQQVLGNARAEVLAAMTAKGTELTGVAFSSHPVERFAAARRVIDENNRCHTRWSVCRDQEVRNAPEGLIDPQLDQVVFYGPNDTPAACLHFYACHPQVSDGRRIVSSDTVGVARDLFQQTNPGVFSLYLTGCAGDITAGKYTTPNRHRNRLVFGVRLFDAMQAAFEKADSQPLTKLGWEDHVFALPLSHIPQDASYFQAIIEDPSVRPGEKYTMGRKLIRLLQNIHTYPFRISRLQINDFNLLFLPAEMHLDYQLYAKALCNQKLAVAAYGDGFLQYVPTDDAFPQGGYEVSPLATQVDAGIQAPIRDGIAAILNRHEL